MPFDSEILRSSVVSPARLCVMISGGGRTLTHIHQLIEQKALNARIHLVIASRPCAGVGRSRALGYHTIIEPGQIPRDRLGEILRQHAIDWVVLGGYLQLVRIPPGYEHRVVNIHPALLPRHAGAGMFGDRVHSAVLASADRLSGCSVHLCDERYDHGPLVLQRTCPVYRTDTVRTLSRRVFALEREAYAAALQLLIA